MAISISIFRLCFLLQVAAAALTLALGVSAERCHPQDKKALLQIKKELNNPPALSSWNPTTDCCETWEAVGCGNSKNRVEYLSLSNFDLKPHPLPIPPSIGKLTHLYFLYIINVPTITGPLPDSISNFTNLHYLQITNTLLSGTIPEFLSRLNSLVTIDLSNSNLAGGIPPSLSALPNLQDLNLSNNWLSGSIPESFGSFSSNFISLSLAHNQISGEIPKSLGKLDLTYVDLSNNRLEGDASMLFGYNKLSTQGINLSRNRLAFDLGKVGLSRTKVMASLDLSYNNIYGKVPEGLKAMKLLRDFNVSYNNLCGRIPTGGNMWRFDASSYLHNKCLCGSPLPSCRKSF